MEDVRAATTTLKPGLLRRYFIILKKFLFQLLIYCFRNLTAAPNPSPSIFRQSLVKSGLNLDDRTFSTLCRVFQTADGIDVLSFLRAVDL